MVSLKKICPNHVIDKVNQIISQYRMTLVVGFPFNICLSNEWCVPPFTRRQRRGNNYESFCMQQITNLNWTYIIGFSFPLIYLKSEQASNSIFPDFFDFEFSYSRKTFFFRPKLKLVFVLKKPLTLLLVIAYLPWVWA